jgi:putative FmdB family regulatory protein
MLVGRASAPPILTTPMPVYEYRCTKGHTFEVIQSMSDDPLTKCEVCGSPVERVLHSPSIHFKGSGFYNTDYGTKKRQREQKSSNSESGSSSSSTSETSTSESSSGSSESGSSSSEKKTDSKSSSSEKTKPASSS